ncbi:Bug family tripartite tricarboxylate transporter substrate binding protein [Paracoccus zhejiangensis]|uniref:Tripartite tricarboxylate transporter substrate-binding protein n=1 Tax=Paracoccus zhejiangensis TaxID=1077935 RepID=A0A2H5F4N2_9RHOB|nr:tripartite tricarboxylate transporter substrate binding protein [Paracoccus zhejiangensis]AUH66504.1 tripartite tricarboxylate transporter substrate-binding protein [Paracoccus zhejiangensis]
MRIATKAVLALTVMAAPAFAEYPERPITMLVPWSAGGGTDAVARILAQEMQTALGQPVNVVNREGAGGIIGHSAMIEAEPDGYTIGLATAEITTYAAIGSSSISSEGMAPVALVNFDASSFNVAANSPWENAKDALADIGANPGKYKASGFPVGAAYHLAFASFMQANGVDPTALTVVPSQGAAPGFQELVSGGVEVVPSSLPEAQPMRDAGLVKTLAVLSAERLEAYPDIPTAEEATGIASVGGTWRGIVAPKDTDPAVVTKLEEAVKTAYDTAAFQEFMKNRGFGMRYLPAGEFGSFMAEAATTNASVIEALGLKQ